jgi:hypothetical protein
MLGNLEEYLGPESSLDNVLATLLALPSPPSSLFSAIQWALTDRSPLLSELLHTPLTADQARQKGFLPMEVCPDSDSRARMGTFSANVFMAHSKYYWVA